MKQGWNDWYLILESEVDYRQTDKSPHKPDSTVYARRHQGQELQRRCLAFRSIGVGGDGIARSRPFRQEREDHDEYLKEGEAGQV